ncbi:dockerin type I domain-containing protein [Aeoliella mucimassa]|uniref:PEP-CTERM protein-sorting domain-containing protein n=1 Tax=Aeoliella mucimassa TaxID=2527972 RepID=A0A518AVF8_9BACT|nr:dockerin type I domain-containing protein [Aeoliella mucimassa]QDU58692.1 hypothetical protein Pan181_49320 [Aeoliella mucimassa]
MKTKALLTTVAVFLVFSVHQASGQSQIGINFIGGITGGGPGGTVTGSAGWQGTSDGGDYDYPRDISQINWNNVAPPVDGEIEDLQDFKGSASDLINSAGETTSLSVSWLAEEPYRAFGGPYSNQDQELMSGYIDVDDTWPTSYVNLTDIPYNGYDLVVYVGTDGNNRTASVQLGNDDNSRTWFVTNTGGGAFSGPEDYIRATAISEFDAEPGNFIVYEGLISSDLEVRITRGTNNAGINGIQLIERSDVPFLTLMVDTVTGVMAIQNNSGEAVDFDAYQIESADGSLNPTGFRSLEDQDYEGNGASGSGHGWEELGVPSANLMGEAFLADSSVLDVGSSVLLGSSFTAESVEDLVFRYHQTGSFTQKGRVEYCENCLFIDLQGDYNSDGVVNLADYTVWRDSLGSTSDLRANGDDTGASQGVVDATDYQVWKANFGASTGASQAVANTQVPEPSSVTLCCLLAIGFVPFGLRRTRCLSANRVRTFLLAATVLVATGFCQPTYAVSVGMNMVGGIGSSASEVNGVAGFRGDTEKGLADVSQANWNNVAYFTVGGVDGVYDILGTAENLKTSENVVTDMSVSWLADNTWAAGNPTKDNDDERLMDGYVDNSTDLTTSYFTLNNIPFTGYDLYIYVGSDGNGRVSYTRLGEDSSSDTYFETNTGQGAFTGPDDYVRAEAKSIGETAPSNFILYEGLLSPNIEFTVNRATGNAGVHGIQVVERTDIPFLSLVVDRVTGYAELRNESGGDVDLDLYQIGSPDEALTPSSFYSLEQQDYEQNGTAGSGNGWEVMGTPSTKLIAESFLQGSSLLSIGASINLGQIFAPGGAETLEILFHEVDGVLNPGRVDYCDNCVAASDLKGDYNGDNQVNLADYTIWRDSLGSTGDGLAADGNNDQVVDSLDYQLWKSHFGQSMAAPLNASASTTQVPEPASYTALLLTASVLACRRVTCV